MWDWFRGIHQFQKNGGVQTEWTYPYVSWYGENFDCKFKPQVRVWQLGTAGAEAAADALALRLARCR